MDETVSVPLTEVELDVLREIIKPEYVFKLSSPTMRMEALLLRIEEKLAAAKEHFPHA